MAETIKLFDIVALLEPIPEHRLIRGSVGTVVDVYANGDFEIEFADNEGEAYAILAISPHQLMILHHEPKDIAA